MIGNQEAFDRVVRHLLVQRAKSRLFGRAGSYCAYRGANGFRCAIGGLLPDDVYDPEMEALSVDLLIEKFPAVQDLLPECSMALTLQSVHDKHEPAEWKSLLSGVAEAHSLDASVLEEFE